MRTQITRSDLIDAADRVQGVWGLIDSTGRAYCVQCADIIGLWIGTAITDPLAQALEVNGDPCERCERIIGAPLFEAQTRRRMDAELGVIRSAALTHRMVAHNC